MTVAVGLLPLALALAGAVAVTVLTLAGVHAEGGGSRAVLLPAGLVAGASIGAALLAPIMSVAVCSSGRCSRLPTT